MSITKQNIFLALCFLAIIVVGAWVADSGVHNTGVVNTGNYDVATIGVRTVTTTVGTAALQLVSFAPNSTSTTKWAVIQNVGTAVMTCSLDDRVTTAASSSVAANKGIVIPGFGTSSTLPGMLTVGQCSNGATNCIPAYGSVNCVATASTTVSVTTK